MLVFCIMITLGWLVLMILSCFHDSRAKKTPFFITALEATFLMMVVCTESVSAQIVIGILTQFIILFAILGSIYDDLDKYGTISTFYETDKKPAFIDKILNTGLEKARKKTQIFVALTVVFSIVTVALRYIIIYPDIRGYFWGFCIAVFMMVITLFIISDPFTEKYDRSYIIAVIGLSVFLTVALNVTVFIVYKVADSSILPENRRVTELTYELAPISQPELHDLQSLAISGENSDNNQVYYIAVGGKSTDKTTESKKESSEFTIFYHSTNSTGLEPLPNGDIHVVYDAETAPKIIEKKTWGFTKYSKATGVESREYFIYLPSEQNVFN